jgi:hypothetical protein
MFGHPRLRFAEGRAGTTIWVRTLLSHHSIKEKSMGHKLTTLIAGLIFAVLPIAALAQVTPGTILTGSFDQNLSSNHAQPGDPISISYVHSDNHDINGAKIYGHVASVQSAGQGRPGKIAFAYDKLVTRSGSTYAIAGYTSNMNVQTKNNAGKELLGAGAGALVGGLIGHGLGAIIGAAGGAVAAKNNRQNVLVPQGSSISVTVTRSRRQS